MSGIKHEQWFQIKHEQWFQIKYEQWFTDRITRGALVWIYDYARFSYCFSSQIALFKPILNTLYCHIPQTSSRLCPFRNHITPKNITWLKTITFSGRVSMPWAQRVLCSWEKALVRKICRAVFVECCGMLFGSEKWTHNYGKCST